MNEFVLSSHGLWFSIAALCIILELLTGTGFLIWLGISALLTGTIHYCVAGLLWQYGLFIFSAISILAVVFWQRIRAE